MNLSENINNSLNYAKRIASDIGRYVILVVLDIIPIVNFIVSGYGARVIQSTPESNEPPKLERYGDMFIDGLKIFVAGFVYLIVPSILIALGVGSFFAGLFGLGRTGFGFAFAGLGIVVLLIGVVLLFLALIIFAIGVAHMLKTNNFGKAFAFGEIRQIIGRIGWGRYLAWLLVLFIIWLLIAAVVGVISFVLPVGGIIFVLLSPFLVTFYSRSVGLMYSDGAGGSFAPPSMQPGKAPYAPAAQAPTRSFCMYCGTRLIPGGKFCPSCGRPPQ